MSQAGGPKPPHVLRVSLADKLDNARAILADYRAIGGCWPRQPSGNGRWALAGGTAEPALPNELQSCILQGLPGSRKRSRNAEISLPYEVADP